MRQEAFKIAGKETVDSLGVVKNFRKVIESRDIRNMNKELYQFLNLHCGFIAHYNIDGFKATYADPKDFAEVFIRHFDRDHRYFSGIYDCHHELYKETGFAKADIKEAFFQIADSHKEAIARWAELKQRNERYQLYVSLKSEFEPKNLTIACSACGNRYDVKVAKDGQAYTDFEIICCLFCGRQIKLY